MAGNKQNTNQDAAAPPGSGGLPAPEPVKIPDELSRRGPPVILDMCEDTPVPSSKVINLSDIHSDDKGSKVASASPRTRKRQNPAQAARLRLARWPVRGLRSLFGVTCPAARKPTMARKRVPAVLLRLNPLRRQSPPPKSKLPPAPEPPDQWKREKSSI